MSAADASENLILAGRGSEDGVFVRKGLGPNTQRLLSYDPNINKEEGKGPLQCRVIKFSPNGQFFAYCDGIKLRVCATDNYSTDIISADLPRTSQLHFSPQSNYLASFEAFAVYVKDGQKQGDPNLHIWDLKTGTKIKSFVQKKNQGWWPQWSDDESLCMRLVGSEVMFHEQPNMEKYDKKYVADKIQTVSLSHGQAPYHFASYRPATKAEPAVVHLVAYPSMSVVSNKTFWKADRVSLHWNKRGTSVIIMAITDVDSTGQSYYGEQTLYLVSTDGEGIMIPLGKNGPVYSVEWSPRGNGFCVVYGYMPAKATLYNLKGEPVFDFGTGARNECHYNAYGTILCLCGFGNLRGNVEFWSVKDRKLIKQLRAEDTTLFEWAPDGEHFMTATTAPRLRVNNGYKIWHYTGQILEEIKTEKEFWEARWLPNSDMFPVEQHQVLFPPPSPALSPSKPVDAMGNTPLPGVNKKGAYVPPHLRNKEGTAKAKSFKIHETEGPTKINSGRGRGRGGGGPGQKNGMPQAAGGSSTAAGPSLSGAEERAKKIRNLQKKIDQIKVLKQRQEMGETLEINQVQKISKQQELLHELETLELS